MNKQEFLDRLRAGLLGLPQEEIESRISFYSEMIDDRIEEGCSEEDAVASVGRVETILEEIIAEASPAPRVEEKGTAKRRFRAWHIVLIVVGAPLWASLLIAALAVLISVIASMWAVIVSLWAVFGALAGSAIGCLAASIFLLCCSRALEGLILMSVGLVLAGISIFVFLGCRAATKGVACLTKLLVVGIKRCFVRKEKTK